MSLREDKKEYGTPEIEEHDRDTKQTYVWWHGGDLIHIYDHSGDEIDVFGVGNHSKDRVDIKDARTGLKKHIKNEKDPRPYYGFIDCPYGYHWVSSYNTKDGTKVSGHCAKNPYGTHHEL